MKKQIFIYAVCILLLCSCTAGNNKEESPSASPSPSASVSPSPSASLLPSASPSAKPPKTQNADKSASGIYGGKADAHSVEIELADGAVESFYVSDEIFEKIKADGIEEGGKISFKYTEEDGRKTISSIN